MIKVLFQKREYSKKANIYFPEEYSYPFKSKFKLSIENRNINMEDLRNIILEIGRRRNVDIKGEWQALLYLRYGVKAINLGEF